MTNKRQMKSTARLYAVQALFQMEASHQTVDQVMVEFLDHRFGAEYTEGEFVEGNSKHFRRVMEAAVDHQSEIDQLTDRALVAKWPIARIDPTLRALFRAAGSEMTHMTTPPKVVINEYITIARAFFPDGDEAKFANAVMDHMAREVKPEAF